MKSNITLETFENTVIEQLKERGYSTKIIEVPGKLGPEHRLVNVDDLTERRNVYKMSAAVNIEQVYNDYMKQYMKGRPPMMESVIKDIIDLFNDKGKPSYVDHFIEVIKSWDAAKARLILSVCNAELNASYLEGKVFERIEDLALVPRVCADITEKTVSSSMISKELMKSWGVTEDEVMREAKRNAPKLLPPVIMDSCAVAMKMVSEMKQNGEVPDFINEKDVMSMISQSPMIIVTTQAQFTGASLFYDGILEYFANALDGHFYIIPSSSAEFLVLPGNDTDLTPEGLSAMIQSVNVDKDNIDPKIVLSNHAYVYKNGKFSSFV